MKGLKESLWVMLFVTARADPPPPPGATSLAADAVRWEFTHGADGWGQEAADSGARLSTVWDRRGTLALRGVGWPSASATPISAWLDSGAFAVPIDATTRIVMRAKYLAGCRGGGAWVLRGASSADSSTSSFHGFSGGEPTAPFAVPDAALGVWRDYAVPLPPSIVAAGGLTRLRFQPCLGVAAGVSMDLAWVRVVHAPVLTRVEGCGAMGGSGVSGGVPPYRPFARRGSNTVYFDGRGAVNASAPPTFVNAKDDPSLPFAATYNCREGDVVTVTGVHLGSEPPVVTVDGLPCGGVEVAVAESSLTCVVPPPQQNRSAAAGTKPSVVRVQNGAMPLLADEWPYLAYAGPLAAPWGALPLSADGGISGSGENNSSSSSVGGGCDGSEIPPCSCGDGGAPIVVNVAARSVDVQWCAPTIAWDAMTVTGYRLQWRAATPITSAAAQGWSRGGRAPSVGGNATSSSEGGCGADDGWGSWGGGDDTGGGTLFTANVTTTLVGGLSPATAYQFRVAPITGVAASAEAVANGRCGVSGGGGGGIGVDTYGRVVTISGGQDGGNVDALLYDQDRLYDDDTLCSTLPSPSSAVGNNLGRLPSLPFFIGENSAPSRTQSTLLADVLFTRFDANSTLDHGPINTAAGYNALHWPGGEGHYGLILVGSASIGNCNGSAACCDSFGGGDAFAAYVGTQEGAFGSPLPPSQGGGGGGATADAAALSALLYHLLNASISSDDLWRSGWRAGNSSSSGGYAQGGNNITGGGNSSSSVVLLPSWAATFWRSLDPSSAPPYDPLSSGRGWAGVAPPASGYDDSGDLAFVPPGVMTSAWADLAEAINISVTSAGSEEGWVTITTTQGSNYTQPAPPPPRLPQQLYERGTGARLVAVGSPPTASCALVCGALPSRGGLFDDDDDASLYSELGGGETGEGEAVGASNDAGGRGGSSLSASARLWRSVPLRANEGGGGDGDYALPYRDVLPTDVEAAPASSPSRSIRVRGVLAELQSSLAQAAARRGSSSSSSSSSTSTSRGASTHSTPGLPTAFPNGVGVVPLTAYLGGALLPGVAPSAPCGPALRLTPSLPSQTGAAWYGRALQLQEGFDTSFVFRLASPSPHCRVMDGVHTHCVGRGGGGLAFVLQNWHPAVAGRGGVGLGYAGIPLSLAVEVDTWADEGERDPGDSHISVHAAAAAGGGSYAPVGGDGAEGGREGDTHYSGVSSNHDYALGHAPLFNGRISEGTHVMRVVYEPVLDPTLVAHPAFVGGGPPSTSAGGGGGESTFNSSSEDTSGGGGGMSPHAGSLSVYLDDLATPILIVPVDLATVLGLGGTHGRAWAGFTAAAGAAWQTQDVLAWHFSSMRG